MPRARMFVLETREVIQVRGVMRFMLVSVHVARYSTTKCDAIQSKATILVHSPINRPAVYD